MSLRVRCTNCDFTDEVEPGFVNTMAEGIAEVRCDNCNKLTLRFEINLGGDTWHHLKTGADK